MTGVDLDLNDIHDTFNAIDANGDKGLCEDEFYNFLLEVNRSSEEVLSEEDASILFKAIDINGDEEISFVELFQFSLTTNEQIGKEICRFCEIRSRRYSRYRGYYNEIL